MTRHGTTTGYKTGCRCPHCAEAHRRYRKDYALRARERKIGTRAVMTRPQSVPPADAIAHLWALIGSGWTMTQIADELGMGRNHLWNIRAGKFARIRLATAARILSLEPLPDLDDYADPVVVDRLIAGADWQAIGATRAERIAAAERLAWYWTPIRARQRADGTAEQACDGESLTSIERRFGLRAGRDFRKAPDAVAQRGAA